MGLWNPIPPFAQSTHLSDATIGATRTLHDLHEGATVLRHLGWDHGDGLLGRKETANKNKVVFKF